MPCGFDSAWCRVGSARATPNEAVPTSLGGLGNPPRLKFPVSRSIGTRRANPPIPDGDIITIPVSVLALNYQCRPDFLACVKPGKGPCMGTGISGKFGLDPP